ncbi:2-octaprenyl-6-methoxyphenyl hydroxylase [Psychromonas sp.]|uniref:2-octaprenyl-6-methoxyphenyl hydroxylase n=1 Tax=Psychromonas sp. TaxID=1884585 RepID=UPI003A971D56
MAKLSQQSDLIEQQQEAILYDVVIVGAGMSGALLALTLLTQNPLLKVLLLDENAQRLPSSPNNEAGHNPSFDARCIALNAGSVDILDSLSLWTDIKAHAQAIENIQVSDKGYFGGAELSPNLQGDAFGYVVELRHVGRVLSRELASFASLTTRYQVKLDNLSQQQDVIQCVLNNGETVTAKLCVGADGSHSQVRTLAGISSSLSDYQRSAIICNVRCHKPHQNIAYERFTKSGPIALLPLTDNRFSLVYCVEKQQAEQIAHLSDSEFLAQLQKKFGYRAGLFEQTGQRDIYPLNLLKTTKPIAHRTVCIGNAAHSLHPVAGQGFNLGLRDLFVLATVIADSDDIGSFSMLNDYWQCREKDHHSTIWMTDSLVRIFSNHYPLLSIPRNIGLKAMNLFPFLSVPIIEQSKGQFDLFNREKLS